MLFANSGRKWICSSSENVSLGISTEKCMWTLNNAHILSRINGYF